MMYNYHYKNMNDSLNLEGKIYISAKRAAVLTGYTMDYVGQLCRAGKLDCKMIGHTWHVNQTSLFQHKLSQANVKAISDVIPSVESTFSGRSISLKKIHVAESVEEPKIDQIALQRRSPYRGRIALAIISACVFVFIAINMIGHSRLSLSGLASMLGTAGEAGLNGIAVAPSTNSVAGDEALKQQIRDSFTDKVNVNPDQNGTAGVITPVFKKASDGSFVYVLVPVKQY
jgi:hypothetical protein